MRVLSVYRIPLVFIARCHSSHPSIQRIRNVGVVAHIDAGKTTLTERLLFLTGEVKHMGDVDSGSTVTDFLEVERERGITVQSAVVSLAWNGHRINLIDTPGHVDFGVEVQRCVRVLDGLLVVLDASAGVQAQTLTVWRQASKHALPTVLLANKMDKPQAHFTHTLNSIEDKLHIKTVPVVVPVVVDSSLRSLVDVIEQRMLSMHDSTQQWKNIEGGSREWDVLCEERENLCLALADVDDAFASVYLEDAKGESGAVNRDLIVQALSRASLSRKVSAVACGSALRSAESVRPCLDLMCHLLPSPLASQATLHKSIGDSFSALLFKISHDKRGRLAYTRVYSGELKSGSSIYNWSKQRREGPVEVLEAQSDSVEGVGKCTAGSIVVLRGTELSRTGDTLLALECEMIQLPPQDEDAAHILFEGIEQPDPVFYCSIEPPDTKSRHALERALKELAIEDPSLRVREDAETGQTILETQGELHLEIIKDRLVRGYKLNVFLGPLQVAYREVIEDTVEHTVGVDEAVEGRTYSASVQLKLHPAEGEGKWKKLKMALPPGSRMPRPDWLQAIKEGVASALHHGPLLAFPVHDIDVSLVQLTTSGGRVSSSLVCAAAHKCMEEALRLKSTRVRLVEPVMQLELTLPSDCPSQSVLQELSRRRAVVEELTSERTNENTIHASLPLSSLTGLSTAVRTLTRGLAHMHVKMVGHQVIDPQEEHRLMAQRRMQR